MKESRDDLDATSYLQQKPEIDAMHTVSMAKCTYSGLQMEYETEWSMK